MRHLLRHSSSSIYSTLFPQHAPSPPFTYDSGLVDRRRKTLRRALQNDDWPLLLYLLRTQLCRNVGGVANPYTPAPKPAPDGRDPFFRLAAASRQLMRRVHDGFIDADNPLFAGADERRLREAVFRLVGRTAEEFGSSATLLSGGGTMGMYHIGVLEALHAADPPLVARIISGASAGSIVASVFATQRDADVTAALDHLCDGQRLEVFVDSDRPVGGRHWFRDVWRTRSFYTAAGLARVMQEVLGDVTFQEAYNTTRRVLNITVSDGGPRGGHQLLNHVTAPDVVVWSAVVSSCALPWAFPVGRLYTKDARTKRVSRLRDSPAGHLDGSLHGDIPMDDLSAEFNINYFVVSQVNPHVLPFVNRDKTRERGRAYRLRAHLRHLARHLLLASLHTLHTLLPTRALRNLDSILRQRYEGDLTLLPVASLAHLARVVHGVMRNPSGAFVRDARRHGRLAANNMRAKMHAVLDTETALRRLVTALNLALWDRPARNSSRRRQLVRQAPRPAYRARAPSDSDSSSTSSSSSSRPRSPPWRFASAPPTPKEERAHEFFSPSSSRPSSSSGADTVPPELLMTPVDPRRGSLLGDGGSSGGSTRAAPRKARRPQHPGPSSSAPASAPGERAGGGARAMADFRSGITDRLSFRPSRSWRRKRTLSH